MEQIENGARFGFIGFGQEAPREAVSCDGLIKGAGLHLSHWRGNATPPEYKRDTSTEIALCAAERGLGGGRLVVNNHFDTDGALSVFALLEPSRALDHRGVLVAAAEVGDFDEWPADRRGLLLDAAVTALAAGAEDEAAYARVLPELGLVLENLENRRDLWARAWDELQQKDELGRALLVEPRGDVVVLRHPPGIDLLPGPVLSRRAPKEARRWLLALERADGRFHYRYERPRFAWADTVTRPVIAAPDGEAIARALGPGWTTQAPGMTAIAATAEAIADAPEVLLEKLRAADPPAERNADPQALLADNPAHFERKNAARAG